MSAGSGKKGRSYEVGYGKPPRHSRFRKGQSGNPKGRPRGSPSLGALLQKELKRMVTARDGDQFVRIRAEEAMMRNLVASAAKGQTQPLRTLLRILDMDRSPEALREQTDGQNARREEIAGQIRESLRKLIERDWKARAVLQQARELGIDLD